MRYLSECSPRGALLVLQVTRFLLAVTTNSFIREMAQGRSRSVDVLRTPRKQKPRQMKTEPVNVLKESAAILAQRCRIPRPWLLDPRGNAFAASSTGHIHHPFNLERVAYRWATLTESLLDSTQFGMRTELPTGFYANRYIANSSAKKSWTGDALYLCEDADAFSSLAKDPLPNLSQLFSSLEVRKLLLQDLCGNCSLREFGTALGTLRNRCVCFRMVLCSR